MRRLFRQFSFPGGIPSHVAPETPGSIHEGGELGYALSHALRRGLRQPGPVVACVVGDGEAETGPLATSWHSQQVPRPGARRRRPADPAPQRLQDRQPDGPRPDPEDELDALLRGLRLRAVLRRGRRSRGRPPAAGRDARRGARRDRARSSVRPREDGGDRAAALADDRAAHAEGLDRARRRSTACRSRARGARTRCPLGERPRRTPGTAAARDVDAQLPARGAVRRRRRGCVPSWRRSRPPGTRRMSANPHANGGAAPARPASCPTSATTPSTCRQPGADDRRGRRACSARGCATSCGATPTNFRVFGPDETARTGWAPSSRSTDRAWMAETLPSDDHLAPDGRVMEVLSEHQCQGWLEGYLLTGRHGLFNCYEAFIHIVDSMFNQHAKWLKVTRDIPWRRPDRVAQLPADVARLAPGPQRLQPPGPGLHRPRREQEGRRHPRLPAARREHPALGRRPLPAQPRLRQRHRRRQAAGAAVADDGRGRRCTARAASASGTGRATTAAASPTSCWRAPATSRPSRRSPPSTSCGAPSRPQGPRRQRRRPDAAPARRPSTRTACRDAEFDALFTTDKPVVFAYHGYPWLIHRLTYRRDEPRQPPRPRLQGGGHDHDAVRHGHAQRPRPIPPRDRRDRPRARARPRAPAHVRQQMVDKRIAGTARTRASDGEDMPEVRDWAWPGLRRRHAPMRVLVVNAGSSSLKLPVLDARRHGRRSDDLRALRGHDDGLDASAARGRPGAIDAVGHRIVHGGTRFTARS